MFRKKKKNKNYRDINEDNEDEIEIIKEIAEKLGKEVWSVTQDDINDYKREKLIEEKKNEEEEYEEEEYEDEEDEKEDEKKDEKVEEINQNDNNSNFNNYDTNLKGDDDSVTEITNEEYKKQIIDSINLIQNAIQKNSTDFDSLMETIINKNLIGGEYYEYINIEEFNDKLMSIGVSLNDLQLSCLCSKFSVPNELRLIDKKKFEKSLEDNLNGVLKIE